VIKLVAAAIVSMSLMTPSAYANDAHHNKYQAVSASAPATTGEIIEGEIRRVDKDAKKITIKHGPMQSLDMPAMTMVFQVKDPGLLDKVKAGDKVKFQAQKVNGAFTVMQIEPAQ
jgi:Cu(I)/Ag(I) efflux system protein CusF